MIDKPDIAQVQQVVQEAANLEEIGSGGYKIVYKALVGGKTEAVKLVQIPGDASDETIRDENLRRIERELAILSRCKSPYLVKLGSIAPHTCKIDRSEYTVYSEEYLSGDSLREMILKDYKPTREELSELGLCLLKAVLELVSMNVIHRDIKPENIIKTHDPVRPYVLLDLGIAFQIGGTPITRNSARIPGTLYYIAPEMLD
jgi:eukaryotic-like serine/threonine-protein kinase